MSYRMSSIQFMTNYQSSLNKTYQKQAKLLEQGDGSSIHRGSDDPVAYSRLLRYKVSANENEQYTKNVENATAWMETTDGALTHIAEITKTFKEKTIEAATDTNNDTNFDAIAKEMWAMIEEIYATSKTQHDGRYVFSGHRDQTEPFTLSTTTENRAVTKTLDNPQVSFFLGSDLPYNNSVYQFVKLQETSSNDIYYLDVYNGKIYSQDLVENDYKDWLTKGVENVSGVNKDVYDAKAADIDSTTAIAEVVSALSGATDAASVTEKLTNAINSYNVSSDTTVNILSCLNEIMQAANSDTQITTALSNAGVPANPSTVSAFEGVLTKYHDILKQSAMMTGYYLDRQGIPTVNGNIDVYVDGEKKTFEILTEPQQMVKYHGDANYISMVKMNGATDTAADTVNAIGKDLFGSDVFDSEASGYGAASGSSMINSMLTVYNKVKAGDVKWLSADGVVLADAANATVTMTQTTVGARLELYTSVKDMLANQSDNITDEIVNVSGTDVAKLATNLMEMTTLYNMALSLGGRVLPQSLADYL